MYDPAPTINPDWTPEVREREMRDTGARYLSGDPAWVEGVVQLAIEHRTSIMHAAYLYQLAHPPATTCELCGQPNLPRHRSTDWTLSPNHALCEARQRRGHPITPLAWAPECSCTPCAGKAAR